MTDDERDLLHMWDHITAAAKWVYNWITVIAGLVVGALAFLPEMLNSALTLLDAAGIYDFTVFGIAPERAAAITFCVAAAKGLLAYYNSRQAQD